MASGAVSGNGRGIPLRARATTSRARSEGTGTPWGLPGSGGISVELSSAVSRAGAGQSDRRLLGVSVSVVSDVTPPDRPTQPIPLISPQTPHGGGVGTRGSRTRPTRRGKESREASGPHGERDTHTHPHALGPHGCGVPRGSWPSAPGVSRSHRTPLPPGLASPAHCPHPSMPSFPVPPPRTPCKPLCGPNSPRGVLGHPPTVKRRSGRRGRQDSPAGNPKNAKQPAARTARQRDLTRKTAGGRMRTAFPWGAKPARRHL